MLSLIYQVCTTQDKTQTTSFVKTKSSRVIKCTIPNWQQTQLERILIFGLLKYMSGPYF